MRPTRPKLFKTICLTRPGPWQILAIMKLVSYTLIWASFPIYLMSIGWEKLPASSRANLSSSTLSDLSQFPADWPEIEYLAFAGDLSGSITAPGQYATFGVALVAPLSRGNVTIVSADTMDRPLINPNWLTSTTDLEVGVEAFKRARMIAKASGIAISEAIPGSAVQSDEEIAKYIRGATVPIHHAAATCKTNPFHPS